MLKAIRNSNGNVYVAHNFNLVSPLINSSDKYYVDKNNYIYKKFVKNNTLKCIEVEITKNDIEEQISNLSQITFEVTDKCNLNCTYCGYGQFYTGYDNRSNKELPLDKATRLIDFLVNFWNSSANSSINKNIFISFYGGEPLLNMNFIKSIVRYIKSVQCSTRVFTFSLTTNAILLNQHIDFLVQNNFNLLISLDGNEENTVYRQDKKGQPAYNNIIKNVDLLIRNYPNYFKENVNFNAVLHNKNSVEEIYNFFKNKYNKIPGINELTTVGIKPEMRNIFIETYKNFQDSIMQSENHVGIEQDMFIKSPTIQSVSTFLHKYSGFVFNNYNDLLYSKKVIKKTTTGTCIPFSKKLFLTVSGKILACERISHQFALGNIDDTKINLNFQEVAEKFNYYLSRLKKQCNKCFNSSTCIQCVYHLPNLEIKPNCDSFMDKEAFASYAGRQLEFLEKNPEAYYKIMEEVIVK